MYTHTHTIGLISVTEELPAPIIYMTIASGMRQSPLKAEDEGDNIWGHV